MTSQVRNRHSITMIISQTAARAVCTFWNQWTLRRRDGNIIVQPKTKECLVSSKALMPASTVFKFMLANPHSKEGIAVQEAQATGEPARLSLPDDDSEVLSVVFNVCRGSRVRLQETLLPAVQFEAAVLCNRYDCVNALSIASRHWMYAYLDRNILTE